MDQQTTLTTIPAESLLGALDGVSYLADRDGTLLSISDRSLMPIDTDDGVFPFDSNAYIGQSLFDCVEAGPVRDSYIRMHDAIWSRRVPSIGFTYRCDAPAIERHMRMSISPVLHGRDVRAILYQSVVLSATPRVPIPLFGIERLLSHHPEGTENPVIVLCSYCHDVGWPAGDAPGEWIEPREYYLRGGRDDLLVSHGVCPDCHTRVVGTLGNPAA
jgi:hypothetical protein